MRGPSRPFSVSPAPWGERGRQGQTPFHPAPGVRDEDTSPVASSFLFFASLSSHPNSYSFPQTKSLSRRADACPTRVLRGLRTLDSVSWVGPSCVEGGWWLLQVSVTSTSKSSENFFRVWGPGALQLQEPPHGLRQVPLSQATVVSRPDVHSALALLSRANHCRKGGGLGISGQVYPHGVPPSALRKPKRPRSLGRARAGPRHSSGKDIFSRVLPSGSQLILRR